MVILIFFALIITFFPVNSFKVYTVEKEEESQLLYHTLVRPGEIFSVKWIHSISKQPVTETYKIRKDLRIQIYEMIFNHHSPNLPSFPVEGTKWEIKNGTYRVYNYNRSYKELLVRIGIVIANHTLYIKNDIIPLKELYKPGGLVKFRIDKIPFIKYLREEVIIWTNKKS